MTITTTPPARRARGEGAGRDGPCPKPAPGRPMVDCGIGGHMYTLHQLPEAPTYD
jgi:hypothetical protein